MSDLPKRVTINEEGPREGFQSEKKMIPVADKVRLIEALADTGLKHIACVSYVNPKRVPTMADAEEVAAHAVLFEEFLAREQRAGRLTLDLKPLPEKKALLHGHCHQKAFGAMSSVQEVLSLVPDLAVTPIESSCCGMAGSFGYEAEHYETSIAMAELSLLPAVRKADAETLVVADGTSCRHQIADGSGRQAVHVAQVLDRALV